MSIMICRIAVLSHNKIAKLFYFIIIFFKKFSRAQTNNITSFNHVKVGKSKAWMLKCTDPLFLTVIYSRVQKY